MFPGRNITSSGTKTSKLTKGKVTSKGSKDAFDESTGLILSGMSPPSISSFIDPCILAIEEKALQIDRLKAYSRTVLEDST